ncbi:hypothetical protein JW851_00590 [Candidatus Woesearchaeota archaeon]|nr:hypothetical protein [Candidatus Woesearchaeota archaeon]
MSYCSQGCGYGNSSGGYASSGYGKGSSYTHPIEDYTKYMSNLEQTIQYTSKSASIETTKPFPQYTILQGDYKIQKTEPEELFLNPARPVTEIVTSEDKIMPYVREAFEKTTGKEFPTNLKVVVLSEKAFNEVHKGHKGVHSQFVQGFAINRNGRGLNEVFVKRNHLDSLMLTIGHEIGHVMSYTLQDERDEEAKAFAFSMAWMKSIKENNIAGIGQCINPRPAVNGIHDKAFEFVLEMSENNTSMQIFEKLVKGELSIRNKLELVTL